MERTNWNSVNKQLLLWWLKFNSICRCIQPWPRDIFVWQTASIVYYTFQSACPLRIYFICLTEGRRRLPFEDFAIFSYGEWTRKGTEVCAKIKSRWWRSCSGGCRCRTGRVGRSWAGARVDTGIEYELMTLDPEKRMMMINATTWCEVETLHW